MARRPHRAERGLAFAAHHQIDAQHHRSRRMPRRLDRMRAQRGVGVEIVQSLCRAGLLDLLEVAPTVHAGTLLVGGAVKDVTCPLTPDAIMRSPIAPSRSGHSG